MKQRNMLWIGLLVFMLLVPVGLTAAQEGIPPFPPDAEDAVVLYPDAVQDAVLVPDTPQQQYILLAGAGNILSVEATMSEAGLVTRLELTDASGAVLVEQVPDSASPTVVLLNHEVVAEGWYFVNVSLGPVGPASYYSLSLTGTTRLIYDVLGVPAPPAIPGAHLVVASAQINGLFEATPLPYLIPLAAGDALSVSVQGPSSPRLRITTFDEAGQVAQTLIAEAAAADQPATYTTTSDTAQWIRIDIEGAQAGAFTLTVGLPRASGMVSDLGEAGMVSTGPSAGSGELCNGIPARFAVGDALVVSQEAGTLKLMKDYTVGSSTSLALVSPGDVVEVLDLPVCFDSPDLGVQTWFWYVYSPKDGYNGWVADGLSDEHWLCQRDDPACNRLATCDLPHAEVTVGGMLIVSETGDDLLILRYPGTTEPLTLAGSNDQLEVLEGPICYYAEWYGSGLWYWKVYSATDDVTGWVVDGTSEETWVCPESNPTCDQ